MSKHVPTPGTWSIDPTHSAVSFTVRHLMISKVRGSFQKFAGTITIDADVAKSTVEATVDVTSVSTNDETRDNHLRTNDFFDVANHPTWTLKSTGLRPDGDDWTLTADLTVRGVTKSVEFEVEFEGATTDPWGNRRLGFSAEAEINRKDWGVEYNAPLEAGGVLIGEKVKLSLDIEAVAA